MFVLPIAHSGVRPLRPAYRRLDSVPSLAQVIDRFFDDVQAAPAAVTRTPALDVDETNTHYLLTFDLPGSNKEELKVSVEGRRVRIETQAAEATPSKDVAVDVKATNVGVGETTAATPAAAEADSPRNLYRERSSVRFARTVSLPQEVDSDASEAKLENGVLSLRLAKRRADGARRLAVN